jgi:hypothetical protein
MVKSRLIFMTNVLDCFRLIIVELSYELQQDLLLNVTTLADIILQIILILKNSLYI